MVSFGLRTVDGSCNNLQPGQATYGAADQTFPRLTDPAFRPAEELGAFAPPTVDPTTPTSYAQTTGSVVDSEPRMISNLIVDQTSTNPAAVAAAEFPVRSQGNEGVKVCTTPPTTPGGNDGLPAGCVPEHQTLDIPNVTTDVGLSPPYNSLFTIFGQFFDHGLDKITNGGSGTVFVPVKADDPLVTHGPDGIAGNGDEVAAGTPMVSHPWHDQERSRRGAQCAEHGQSVRRPEPDLHLALISPGLPARVPRQHWRRPGHHRKVPQHA